jgi:hypothetical protein
MKVLYYGGTFCSEETLKRLLVVAKEIAFIDRPSIKLSATSGTVGVETLARRLAPFDPKTGIVISAHAPYDQAVPVFHEYLKRDWANPQFRQAVLDAARRSSSPSTTVTSREHRLNHTVSRLRILDRCVRMVLRPAARSQ